jgi:hypothetical protein
VTKKAAELVKQVSVKVAEAACQASFNLGLADGLLVTGISMILVSAWVLSWIRKGDHLKP